MNGHKVTSVTELYSDSKKMYTDVVCGSNKSANQLIATLERAINNLKTNWKGVDAGVQINSVVGVYNALVRLRNALAQFAYDSANVAVKYRDIQAANTNAGVEQFSALNIEFFNIMNEYSDSSDTIDIAPDALNGSNDIATVAATLSDFYNAAYVIYEDIMDNWTAGAGRDSGEAAFADFKNNYESYSATLNDVSSNIKQALKNYGI